MEKIDEILLDLVHVSVTKEITKANLLMSPRVCAYLVYEGKAIRTILLGYLAGKNFDPVVISYPENWWQAFRQRWLPGWWLTNHPVVMANHKIIFRQIYPNFRLALPDEWSKIKVRHFGPGIMEERDVEGEEFNKPV